VQEGMCRTQTDLSTSESRLSDWIVADVGSWPARWASKRGFVLRTCRNEIECGATYAEWTGERQAPSASTGRRRKLGSSGHASSKKEAIRSFEIFTSLAMVS